MRTVERGLVLVALALAAGAAVAKDREIVLNMEDISLRAVESETLNRARARKVLKAGRTAFTEVANRFALSSKTIFLYGPGRPIWAKWDVRRDPRIWIVLGEKIRTKDMGADAYLKRMARGELTIHLPAPDADPAADDLHRLYREVSHAVLAQTTWCACPIWLREGIAEYFGAIGAENDHALLTTMERELSESADDLSVGELLAATDRQAWGRGGGRSVSWALVTMMEQSNKKLVPSLLNQSRLFLNHLVTYPNTGVVKKEFTEIVLGQLRESGLPSDRLAAALTAWVKAGFPEGSAYRRTAAHKILKRAKLPKVFGMGLAGRFASRTSGTDEKGVFHIYQPFAGGTATWRFPWAARLELWIGVRGRPGTNYALRPKANRDGYFLPYPAKDVPPKGTCRIAARVMDLRVATTKYGFIWAGVTSPNGLGYLYRQEYKLK
jgi:hypothetical protein